MASARAYLENRLDAERSMTYNLEIVMREAATRVVNICYAYNIAPEKLNRDDLPLKARQEIDAVIQWLRETIIDYFETLAVADHKDNRDLILPYIYRKSHGATFDERLDGYLGNYEDELLFLITAGVALGLGRVALAESIGRNLKRPYENPELADGMTAPTPTYGRGRTNSMYTAIAGLTRFGVGEGWMHSRHVDARKQGAAGFYTFRNSSVPCDICDDYAYYMHYMDDQTPPLHLNCICGTVYVDANGLPVDLK